MKLLTRLEKNTTFWILLIISVLFFLLRLPSLIEPNWYGDEGIYQVIAQAMNNGRLLYAQIWDNKPPLLYMVYALFHGDQFQVRLFSMFSSLVAVWGFLYLAQLLFKRFKASLISTIIFVLLFATPLLEGNIANAENFILPLTITAGLLVYAASSKIKIVKLSSLTSHLSLLFTAGLLLGIAFLFKIVALFDFAAFFIFLLITSIPNSLSLRGDQGDLPAGRQARQSQTRLLRGVYPELVEWTRNDGLPFLAGFLAPLIITSLYFLANHAFSDFLTAVFSSNVGYVGWKNKFIIPQGFLILKLILLGSTILFIYWKRKHIDKPIIFIVLWFAFSLFNTFFSGRPYTHYALVSLPAFCLLLGLFFDQSKPRTRFIILLILICGGILIHRTFKPNLSKTLRYYANTTSFLTGRKNVVSYQSFFDQKTPRDYQIASFIKTHTDSSDNVFIWGDSAQIYALSRKLPPGKYTVSYHINQYESGLSQTQSDLNTARPKYIITLPESRPFPFQLLSYNTKFVFRGVVVYERNF